MSTGADGCTSPMSDSNLIKLTPSSTLTFSLERGTQPKTVLRVANLTVKKVLFKVKTSQPTWYYVRPNQQVLGAGQAGDVTILMVETEANRYLEQLAQHTDDELEKGKFLVQSRVIEDHDYDRIIALPTSQQNDEFLKLWEGPNVERKNQRLCVEFTHPDITKSNTDTNTGAVNNSTRSPDAIFSELQTLRKKYDAVIEYTVHLTAERDAIVTLLDTTQRELTKEKSKTRNVFQGYTALTWAALEGDEDVVDVLLQSGKVDVNTRGHDGKSALDVAKTDEIKAILRRAGASESPAVSNAVPTTPPAHVPPVPPTESEDDPVLPAADVRLMRFQARLARHIQQVEEAPARVALWRRQDALRAETIAALSSTSAEVSRLPALVESLSAMEGECEQLRLSAADFLTLRERHIQLVEEVTEACRELKQNKQHAQLVAMGTVLASCKALDLTSAEEFPQRKECALQPGLEHAQHSKDLNSTLSTLLEQKRVIAVQVHGAETCRALSQRRFALQAQYDAADAADDFKQLGALGLLLDSVDLETAQLPVTQTECVGLADRHTELLQQLRGLAQAVLAVVTSGDAEYDTLQQVCVALVEVQSLDLSELHAEGAFGAAMHSEIDEDGACDPVFVPNSPVNDVLLTSSS